MGAWARRIYSLKFPPVWWLAALGIPVAYWLFGYGAARIATGEWPDPAGFGLTEKLPGLGAVGVAAVWLLTFGLGEESGWRGWLLAEVSRRGSVLRGSLVVAGVWMLWHLPAFFYNPTYMAMGGGIVGWALGLTAGSVFLSWMTARARWSIVPVLIWHAGFNLLTASDQAAGLIAAVISSLVMVQGVHAAVALSRRGTLVSRPADATI
ncbi:CPBP family glutamic-type intramembrane protease [Tessaracoccus sp. G1721]